MFASAQPILAQIKATTNLVSDDPPEGYATQMRYTCDVYMPDSGPVLDWTGIRSFGPTWGSDVLCVAPNTNDPDECIVGGILFNDDVFLFFSPRPALGPCNGDGGGGGTIDIPPGQSDPRPGGPIRPVFPVPTPGIPGAPSPLMQFLLMASRTELLALKRALEAV